MGGSALLDATDEFPWRRDPRGRREAAGLRAAAITLDEDKVVGPGGKSFPLKELAGLTAEGAFLNKKHTYSYGAHAAHITVDPKLGQIEIVDYVVVQDVGRAINPLTLRGQVIGSLVQGLGGACWSICNTTSRASSSPARSPTICCRPRPTSPTCAASCSTIIPRRSIRSAPRAPARAASSRPAARWRTRWRTRCNRSASQPRAAAAVAELHLGAGAGRLSARPRRSRCRSVEYPLLC